ncbi:unnamed protein product [Amaranthus hypochondriacus]
MEKLLNNNTTLSKTTSANHQDHFSTPRCVWVNGPVIIGAGPSGLAVAAGLKQQGVPYIMLERSNCIASLWQTRTYHRLKLHLPKQFCQLPNFPFPKHYPQYPSKDQFITYLESYVKHYKIKPQFNESVQSAHYDETCGLWRIITKKTTQSEDKTNFWVSDKIGDKNNEIEYICRWIVVATGENAEKNVPKFFGFHEFGGDIIHACDYKCGEKYKGKKVLVVGCGNSGMEVSLDLSNHDATPLLCVRSSVHILPKEVVGKSTFELAMSLLRWFKLTTVDKILLILARILLGNTEKYGLKRPEMGPLQLKNKEGKTPVLDLGTFQKIKSGKIKVVPGIKRFSKGKVAFLDGQVLQIDSVVLATGYRSNVPSWLKESEFFSKNGFPKAPFPNGWKGNAGLYAAGFTRRGLSGASEDAIRIAEDIGRIWKQETKQRKPPTACHRRCISHF